MALSKEITNENGIVTNYHKITHIDMFNSTIHCMLESYVSKDYRIAEHSADRTNFSFEITLEEEESMGIRALCYSKIKALEAWSDAIDC